MNLELEQIKANQKAFHSQEKEFKKGMAQHAEGCLRPHEYSPLQLGWDAAEAMKQVKIEFMKRSREDFGTSKTESVE